MIYILSLETATRNCSVAISANGNTIACKEIAEEGFSHAEKLHVFIAAILKDNSLALSDLSAIAVSQGPGSYTGLRIGVSAAKGLSYALDIPLIAIDTLLLLAKKIKCNDGIIIPMIDARRMECYTAIFDSNYAKIRETIAEIIDENTFQESKEIIHLVGDGAEKCKSILNNSKFVYYDDYVFPSSNEMGLLAFEKYNTKDFVDVAYFEPFYLKDFLVVKSNK